MELDTLLDELVESATLTGATLSSPRGGGRPSRITVDPVTVRGNLLYRFREHHPTRTIDTNLDAAAARQRLRDAIGPEFRQALLHAPDADWQVLAGGKGDPRLLRRAPTRPSATREHDRRKRRLIPEGTPVPFLVELGVMTKEGKVRAARQDKYRQISRFVELVDDVLPTLPDGTLRIVDFGSGRSYLTFALHHLLTNVRGRQVEIVGLDLKEDVVSECEGLARKLDAAGLRFEVGDIAGYPGTDGADLVVSLHACDTATDAALDRAVRAETRVILAVPCCQHELQPQLANVELEPLLRYGTLRERFAAEVTDAIRAHLLRLSGYDVQVVEFVPLEHTPKNVLLRAVRRTRELAPADVERLGREYRAFVDGLAVDPALERLLHDRLPPGGSRAVTCCELSDAADERLAGTATRAERFLLLEVRGAWGRDPLGDSELPDVTLRHVQNWLADTPSSRALFVRRPDRRSGPLAMYHVDCRLERTMTVALDRLEDVADVDVETAGTLVTTPLLLVCAHGRRDACCARIGVPLYDALRAVAEPGVEVWQSSHHGGHRFAGNVLVLPHGVQLGRVQPGDATAVATATRAREIPLAFFRGRTLHEPAAQAAEAVVREQRKLVGLDEVSVDEVDDAVVRLTTPGGTVTVRVAERPGPSIPLSCGDEAVPTTTFEARLVD